MGTKRKSMGMLAIAVFVCALLALGAIFATPFTRAYAENVDLGNGVTVNIEGKLGKLIDPSKPAYTGYEQKFDLNNKTYYNLENGYLVGTLNGTTYTIERAFGNIRVKKSGAELVKDMIDPNGEKVGEEFMTGADDPSTLIRIYFGGDKAKVKAALKSSYQDFIASNPGFNPGIVCSMVKKWNEMLVQDFYFGDSEFNGWADGNGSSQVLGRAHLCSLIYNPNLGKFVMMTDYLKLWDDKKVSSSDGTRALGYPVTQMYKGVRKVKNVGEETFTQVTDLQIFEQGYMYKKTDGTAEFVLGKSCTNVSAADEYVFENYLKTEPHRYNEYGTIVTQEVAAAQGITSRFIVSETTGGVERQYIYTNYLRGYTKCIYSAKDGVALIGTPAARAGVWAVKGSDDTVANVTEKYVPMSYEIASFGEDTVDVGMNVSVAHGIDAEAKNVYESYGKTDTDALREKFVAKYEALRASAESDPHKMTPGVASDIIKTWATSTGSQAVICQDYYDGDSTGGFGGDRTNVTVLIYSNRNDAVYALRDEFVNAYGSRISTLGEPRSDMYANAPTPDNAAAVGKVQNFRTGALYITSSGSITTYNGKHYDGSKYVDIVVDDTDIMLSSFTLKQLQGEASLTSYVKDWTETEFTAMQSAFLAKYKAMKTDAFNPGQPTLSGIRIYRTATAASSPIVCQLYESGTKVDSGVWMESGSSVTLALIYNFDDNQIYAVNGGVLTKAATLLRGWPGADSATGLQAGNEALFGKDAKYFEFKRGAKVVTVAYTEQAKWQAKAASYASVCEAKQAEVLESVKVEFLDSELTKKVGDTFKLAVSLTPPGIDGITLKYRSDDEEVATVDAQGNVTIVGEGYCTITVWIDGYSKPTDASDTEAAEIWKNKHSECDIDVKRDKPVEPNQPATSGGCKSSVTGGAIGIGAGLMVLAAGLLSAKRGKRD